ETLVDVEARSFTGAAAAGKRKDPAPGRRDGLAAGTTRCQTLKRVGHDCESRTSVAEVSSRRSPLRTPAGPPCALPRAQRVPTDLAAGHRNPGRRRSLPRAGHEVAPVARTALIRCTKDADGFLLVPAFPSRSRESSLPLECNPLSGQALKLFAFSCFLSYG